MFKVHERNEELAKKIVNSQSDMTYAGVLAGNNPGEVWVDSLKDPKGAIVFYNGQGGFQFMGNFTDEVLRDNLKTFVFKTAKEFLQGAKYFDFAVDNEKWLTTIKSILGDKQLEEVTQFVYRLKDSELSVEDDKLPRQTKESNESNESNKPTSGKEAISIAKTVEVDESFIYEIQNGIVSNPEFLLDYIKVWWGTVENYVNKGHGFAAIQDGKIVSYCMSTAAYKNIHGVGVETLKEYRKMGIAASLTNRLLTHLANNKIEPWWDCWEGNIASQKTIEKYGLKIANKYKVYSLKYD